MQKLQQNRQQQRNHHQLFRLNLSTMLTTDSMDPPNLFASLDELKELMNAKFVSLESLLHKSLAEKTVLNGKVEQLSERCDYLESSLASMKYEVDRPNREAIMNNVAVFGVPESAAGSPESVMDKIGALISFTLDDSNVKSMKTIKNKHKKVSTIIIEFVSYDLKQKFLDKRKAHGTVLLSDVCNVPQDPKKKIFMRDELTKYGMSIYGELLAVKKMMPFKFVWTKHADVFAKVDENSKYCLIKLSVDIKKFIESQNTANNFN
jgi:hypothetical protein